MDLREQGFRLCASPLRTVFRWVHPLEIPLHYLDWTDCTGMNDEEFDAFVRGGASD